MSKDKSQILKLLLELKPELSSRFYVSELGVFGSLAKGGFDGESDVDILVEFDQPAGWLFFDLKFFLEEKLGREVDLVTKRSIRPQWQKEILESTVYV